MRVACLPSPKHGFDVGSFFRRPTQSQQLRASFRSSDIDCGSGGTTVAFRIRSQPPDDWLLKSSTQYLPRAIPTFIRRALPSVHTPQFQSKCKGSARESRYSRWLLCKHIIIWRNKELLQGRARVRHRPIGERYWCCVIDALASQEIRSSWYRRP